MDKPGLDDYGNTTVKVLLHIVARLSDRQRKIQIKSVWVRLGYNTKPCMTNVHIIWKN